MRLKSLRLLIGVRLLRWGMRLLSFDPDKTVAFMNKDWDPDSAGRWAASVYRSLAQSPGELLVGLPTAANAAFEDAVHADADSVE